MERWGGKVVEGTNNEQDRLLTDSLEWKLKEVRVRIRDKSEQDHEPWVLVFMRN